MIYLEHKLVPKIKNLCRNQQRAYDRNKAREPQTAKKNHKVFLRKHLGLIFFNKCGYCEQGNVRSLDAEDNIMHYRPPIVSDNDELNYGWLSWQWPNLLYVCKECNQARNNRFKIDGELSKPNVYQIVDLDNDEVPRLINPCYVDPSIFFCYERDSKGFVKIEASKDLTLAGRAKYTIDLMDLNRLSLQESRGNTWNNFASEIIEIINLGNSTTDQSTRAYKKFQSLIEDCKADKAFAGLKRFLLIEFADKQPFFKTLFDKYFNDPESDYNSIFEPNIHIPAPYPDYDDIFPNNKVEEQSLPNKNTEEELLQHSNEPKITISLDYPLEDEIQQALKTLFENEHEIEVREEVSKGFSGAKIFIVVPYTDDQAKTWIIAKLGPKRLVQKERDAYHELIEGELGKAVKLVPPISHLQNYSGIKYNIAGKSIFHYDSIKSILIKKNPSFDDVERIFIALLTILENFHRYSKEAVVSIASIYDRVLPTNLYVEPVTNNIASAADPKFASTGDIIELRPNEWLTVDVENEHQKLIVTLNKPNYNNYPKQESMTGIRKVDSFKIKIETWQKNTNSDFQIEQRLNQPVLVKVTKTRKEFLNNQLQEVGLTTLFKDRNEWINPIEYLEPILRSSILAKVSKIHGDLNLENVLTESSEPHRFLYNGLNIIDFADARCDLAVHDYQRLECSIWLYVVSDEFVKFFKSKDLDIEKITIIQKLLKIIENNAKSNMLEFPIHLDGFQKSLLILTKIRQQASHYVKDVDGYYKGLILYILGSLKFNNLDNMPSSPLPKQIAFIVSSLLTNQLFGKSSDLFNDPPMRIVKHPDKEMQEIIIPNANLKKTELPSRVILRKRMSACLSVTQIKTIVFDMGFDYQEVTSEKDKKSEIIISLIDWCENRHLLGELVTHCKQLCPQYDWDE